MISVDILPDEVILGIFYSYLLGYRSIDKRQNAWHPLVHVCRRWRTIVFGSPRHLDLQLVCTARTRAREMLDVWPAFPLNIWCLDPAEKMDNIIAVLERTDRVCVISMYIPSSDWEILLAAMQQPFPELRSLRLYNDETALVVPDSILGGSASKDFYLDLNPLDHALAGQADVRLPRHVPSSPLSNVFGSRGSANIWRTSWTASMPLNSTTWK